MIYEVIDVMMLPLAIILPFILIWISLKSILFAFGKFLDFFFPVKDDACDCVTRVQHYGFFFVGEAGYSLIPDRDCPKCNGTGKIDPKSPYANKPSPVRGRPPNPALVAATGAAAASIAATAMRDNDWHDQYQRQLDDDRRSRDDMLH